jgi:hypothetical protein
MLVRSALVLAFALPALISGKVPLVDGVIGGVRDQNVNKLKLLDEGATTSTNAPARTPGKLRVIENSGVCGRCLVVCGEPTIVFTVVEETTPGVYQASGYGDLTANESIWFVFHLSGALM